MTPSHHTLGNSRPVNPYEDRTPPSLLGSTRRNLKGLIQLIDRLFERHSRLLILRMDLGYQEHVAEFISVDDAQMHREHLLGDRRHHAEVFEGLLGYAWSLEYGDEGAGYHYHLLAFYDGSVRKDDIGIGLAIQHLWSQITEANGRCYISNFDKARFELEGILGIGMIHRDDLGYRKNLVERVATYLHKKSGVLYMQDAGTERAFRTFGKSWMPKPLDPDVPRRGRPPTASLAAL
ncbi:MAG: inovirus-type Gp2 protein [Burkholderiaceae bacterium]|nr:inovirus-type Gp2 protein [Burkholderiaceae bacterium]